MFEEILPASSWHGAVDGWWESFPTMEEIKRGEKTIPENRFENIFPCVIGGLPYTMRSIDQNYPSGSTQYLRHLHEQATLCIPKRPILVSV